VGSVIPPALRAGWFFSNLLFFPPAMMQVPVISVLAEQLGKETANAISNPRFFNRKLTAG
jgi:hypothetical protein